MKRTPSCRADMTADTLRVGITCYPSVGGSGVLATALGEELAARGHDVHFIATSVRSACLRTRSACTSIPSRSTSTRLFRYPDYTLPALRSAHGRGEPRASSPDVLHVHYAVPHATAAILARAMPPPASGSSASSRPCTAPTRRLLGHDPGYAPAIKHALTSSDAVTAVSESLKQRNPAHARLRRPDRGHPQLLSPAPARPHAEVVRAELGLGDEVLVVHSSNLRPGKRVDLLLETVARLQPRERVQAPRSSAGEAFAPFVGDVRRLGPGRPRDRPREGPRDRRTICKSRDVGLYL